MRRPMHCERFIRRWGRSFTMILMGMLIVPVVLAQAPEPDRPYLDDGDDPAADTTAVAAEDEDDDAQPFVEAVTLGAGLATYQGDLSQQLGTPFTGALLRSGIDLFANAERTFGPAYLAGEGGFSFIQVRDEQYGFSNRVLRAELQAGLGIDWLERHLVRLYTGFGVLHHRPIHRDPAFVDSEFETRDIDEGQWSASVPLGVVINQRVRVAVRWVLDDTIDNAIGGDTPYDFILHVTIGQPIPFN